MRGCALEQGGDRRASDVEDAEQIGREDRALLVGRDLPGRDAACDRARAGERDVEAAERVPGGLDGGGHRAAVGHIGADRDGVAGGGDHGRELLGGAHRVGQARVICRPVDDDRISEGIELGDGGGGDPAGGSGDERDAAYSVASAGQRAAKVSSSLAARASRPSELRRGVGRIAEHALGTDRGHTSADELGQQRLPDRCSRPRPGSYRPPQARARASARSRSGPHGRHPARRWRGSRRTHRAARRAAAGPVGQRRGDDDLASALRKPTGERERDLGVGSERQVRAVLLGGAEGNDEEPPVPVRPAETSDFSRITLSRLARCSPISLERRSQFGDEDVG